MYAYINTDKIYPQLFMVFWEQIMLEEKKKVSICFQNNQRAPNLLIDVTLYALCNPL